VAAAAVKGSTLAWLQMPFKGEGNYITPKCKAITRLVFEAPPVLLFPLHKHTPNRIPVI